MEDLRTWSGAAEGDHSHNPEVLLAHANAALTPRHRLKLARAIVEDGWTVSYAAAVFNVSWPTANKWANRYRTGGPAAMADRSSRPHSCPRRTPRPVVRKIVHLRWKKRLGPVAIADRLGMGASAGPAGLARRGGPRGARPPPPHRPPPCRRAPGGADPPLRTRPPRLAAARRCEEA